MLCPKCGKEIPDDALYCIFCGQEVKTAVSEDLEPENINDAKVETTQISSEEPADSVQPVTPPPADQPKSPEFKDTTGRYISLVKFIVLYCITFGIYGLFWQYKTTVFLNNDDSEPVMNPTHALLLYMFVPFYNVYWFYKNSQKLVHMTKETDRHAEIPAAVALLSVGQINLLSAVILQDRINALSCENINYSYKGVLPEQDIEWKDHHIDIVAHAILLAFTYGIYHLYWIYKTTQILNRDKAEKYQDPAHTTLFCLFVPLYTIYWYYLSSKKLNHISAQEGAEMASPVLYTALSFMGASLLGSVFMQERINQIISVQVTGNPKQKLHKCKECHTIYTAAEDTCPNCHSAYKKPFYKHGWFIALLVIGAIIVYGTMVNSITDTVGSIFGSHGGYQYSYNYGYEYPQSQYNDPSDYYKHYFSEEYDDSSSGMLIINASETDI